MATSGSYNFSLNKTNIIQRALESLRIVSFGTTPSSSDYSYASDVLNGMIKMWQAEGIQLWKRKQAYIFTQLDQVAYELGSVSGASHVTNSYVSTTTSAAALTSATTITLTSVTGMSTSDNIGIELDDGTRQWTTITNINTGTKVVTLNTALTDDVASGNTVVTYTSKINRPLEIIMATTLDLKNNNTEVLMKMEGFDQYFGIPVKTTSGRPTVGYYDELLNNALPYTGTLYVFPEPSDVGTIIKIIYHESLQDMLNTTDDPDFPQSWTLGLITNLSYQLANLGYGKFIELEQLRAIAMEHKQILLNSNSDKAPLRIKVRGPFRR